MNYEFFSIFILAHLVGDFVLQTDKIAYLKASSRKGLIIHTLIIGIVQIAFLSLYGISGFFCGFICAVLHLFIDQLKNILSQHFNILQFILFLFDQCLHISIIYFLTIYAAPDVNLNIIEIDFIISIICFVFLTYVATITVKIILRDIYPEIKKGSFFQKGERLTDALYSLFFFGLLNLTNIYLCLLLLLLLTVIYYILLNKRYSSEIIIIKIIFFSVISFIINTLVM